jgi:hypothetical protein
MAIGDWRGISTASWAQFVAEVVENIRELCVGLYLTIYTGPITYGRLGPKVTGASNPGTATFRSRYPASTKVEVVRLLPAAFAIAAKITRVTQAAATA